MSVQPFPLQQQTYPFGAVPGVPPGAPIPFDVIIDKSYPRVAFVPTEQSGVYAEIVEVNGDLWMVQNATFDVNLQNFYQEATTVVNCNAANPAFAWCQRGMTGDAIRFYAVPTNDPTQAVTWIQSFDTAPNGTVISPLPITGPGQPALAVNAVFNGSVSSALTAFAVNVNNVASDPIASSLAQYTVNGATVWRVDETGTLRVGNVSPATLNPPVYTELTAGTGIAVISAPPTATIGLSHGDYVDVGNAQTITGIKTIQSPNSNNKPPTPLNFGFGTGNIVGGSIDDLYECSGCVITDWPGSANGLTALAKSTFSIIVGLEPMPPINPGDESLTMQMLVVYIDSVQNNLHYAVGQTFSPTPVAYFDQFGNLTLVSSLSVGGNLNLTGGLTIGGPLTVGGLLTLNGGLSLGPTAVQNLLGQNLEPHDSANDANVQPPNSLTHQKNGSGLLLGYDSINNAIMFDTTQLALIGNHTTGANATGLTSQDQTVTISKTNGGGFGADQNVDFSVASAITAAFPIYANSGNNPLNKPMCIFGNVNNISLSGTNGPAGGSVSATQTVNFTKNFGNANYGLAVSTTGGWMTINVSSTTAGGFTFTIGDIQGSHTSASMSWIAIGSQ